MSTFTQAVERIDANTNSIAEMFGGSTPVAANALRRRPDYELQLLEAERFMADIFSGRRPLHHFSEAMTTSDFQLLFADSLDRQLLGAYQATTPTWQNYARSAVVNDFRPVKRFATSGVRGRLEKVGEQAEFKRRAQSDASYTYSVSRYEGGFGLSFEALINDDLDAFRRLPQDLADSVRDSEEVFVAELFAGASGLNTTNYTVGNENILTSNPVLTRSNLQAAITVLRKRKDANGNPIVVNAVELVVGPGLELTAREILDATEYRSVGSDGDVTIISGNGIAANLRLSVNSWIPAVATTANADTSWWLFASPNAQRPALEFGRLRGYEAPALYEKVPDMRRIGGGLEMVSFDNATSEKKVMAIYGGAFIDPKMTCGSNGSGT